MSKNELVIVGKYNVHTWVNRERECVCLYLFSECQDCQGMKTPSRASHTGVHLIPYFPIAKQVIARSILQSCVLLWTWQE